MRGVKAVAGYYGEACSKASDGAPGLWKDRRRVGRRVARTINWVGKQVSERGRLREIRSDVSREGKILEWKSGEAKGDECEAKLYFLSGGGRRTEVKWSILTNF